MQNQQHLQRVAQQQQEMKQLQLMQLAQASAKSTVPNQCLPQQQVLAAADSEAPPEVPVRRSSQQAQQQQQWQRSVPRQAQYSMVQARLPKQRTDEGFFDPEQLPRPLLAEPEWRGPPGRPAPPAKRLGKRPSQPPPPPPPPVRHRSDDYRWEEEEDSPLARPAMQLRSSAPKNIWSPSSSSVASSSCEPDSLSGGGVGPAGRVAPPTSGSSTSFSGAQRTYAEMSRSSSGQNTIVERQLTEAELTSSPAEQAQKRAAPSANNGNEPGATQTASADEPPNERQPGERSDEPPPKTTLSSNEIQSVALQHQHETGDAKPELLGAADGSGESERSAQGDATTSKRLSAPPQAEPASGWRSFSVTLQEGEDLRRIRRAASSKATEQDDASQSSPTDRRRENFLRSYSIATSTLPAAPAKRVPVKQQQRNQERTGWNTLPARPSATPEGSQMWPPVGGGSGAYKRTLIKETCTVSHFEQRLKLASNDDDEAPLAQRLEQRPLAAEPALGGQRWMASSERRGRESADLGEEPLISQHNAAAANNAEQASSPERLNIDEENSYLQNTYHQAQPETELDVEQDRRTKIYESASNNNGIMLRDQHFLDATAKSQQQRPSSKSTIDNEWYKQMYKQMQLGTKQTPEKCLLQAVNSQPDTTQIRIKLKSPKNGKFGLLPRPPIPASCRPN